MFEPLQALFTRRSSAVFPVRGGQSSGGRGQVLLRPVGVPTNASNWDADGDVALVGKVRTKATPPPASPFPVLGMSPEPVDPAVEILVSEYGKSGAVNGPAEEKQEASS